MIKALHLTVAILQKAFLNLLFVSVQGNLILALRHVTGNALLESREQKILPSRDDCSRVVDYWLDDIYSWPFLLPRILFTEAANGTDAVVTLIIYSSHSCQRTSDI